MLNLAGVTIPEHMQGRPCLDVLQAALSGQPNKYITRVANHAVNVLQGTNSTVR